MEKLRNECKVEEVIKDKCEIEARTIAGTCELDGMADYEVSSRLEWLEKSVAEIIRVMGEEGHSSFEVSNERVRLCVYDCASAKVGYFRINK